MKKRNNITKKKKEHFKQYYQEKIECELCRLNNLFFVTIFIFELTNLIDTSGRKKKYII